MPFLPPNQQRQSTECKVPKFLNVASEEKFTIQLSFTGEYVCMQQVLVPSAPVIGSDVSVVGRSHSLEPLGGLATWGAEVVTVELYKGDRGLGFSILDYQV